MILSDSLNFGASDFATCDFDLVGWCGADKTKKVPLSMTAEAASAAVETMPARIRLGWRSPLCTEIDMAVKGQGR